jgi:hypothetical protein
VGVYDRGAGRLRLYVDGELHGSGSAPVEPWRAAGPLRVGAAGTATNGNLSLWAGTISDVKTWRGALTADHVAEVYGGNPAVQQLSRWNLDGSGADEVGTNSLTVVGTEGVDYDWVEDRTCFPWSALGLQMSGQGFARTAGPVVATDESYTVATWVKLDSLTGGYQTVVAQRGAGQAAFYLQVTPDGGWRLALPQSTSDATNWAGAETPAGVVVAGAWTHVAAAFDLARGEIRLYVNGELAAAAAGPESPWQANGPFYIGAGGAPGGVAHQPVRGSVDEVAVWSSTLDPDRIASLGRPVLGGGGC